MSDDVYQFIIKILQDIVSHALIEILKSFLK